MKLIKSRIPRTTVSVSTVPGGASGYDVSFENYVVSFENYQAVVPEAVADALVALHPDFYTLVGDIGEHLKQKTVLVVRDTGMGDVLLTTPLIRKLHNKYYASVDVLTSEAYRCLFDDNPHVKQTHALDGLSTDDEATLFAAYDIVLDLRLVVENSEAEGSHDHRADAFAAFADVTLKKAERTPDLFLSDADHAVAQEFRKLLGKRGQGGQRGQGVIGYVRNSSTSNRNWSDATHYAVLDALAEAGYGVLVLSDDNQKLNYFYDGNEAILDLSGAFSVRQVIGVLSGCDLVITPDTGLFHVAAALELPTLTYFGAFPVEERAAHKSLAVINEPGGCAIAPCRSYRCFNRDKNGQPVCLAVSPESVVSFLHKLEEAHSRLNDLKRNVIFAHDAIDTHEDEPARPAVVRTDDDGGAADADVNGGEGDEGDHVEVLPEAIEPGGDFKWLNRVSL